MTLVAEGVASATIGSTATLATDTAGGVYECRVDASAMTLGDRLALITLVAARSGGTAREVDRIRFAHVQVEPMLLASPLEAVPGATVTFQLLQTAGTGRAFAFSVTRS